MYPFVRCGLAVTHVIDSDSVQLSLSPSFCNTFYWTKSNYMMWIKILIVLFLHRWHTEEAVFLSFEEQVPPWIVQRRVLPTLRFGKFINRFGGMLLTHWAVISMKETLRSMTSPPPPPPPQCPMPNAKIHWDICWETMIRHRQIMYYWLWE